MPALPLPSNLAVYKRVAGANPAAGSEVTDAVPAGKWWWLLSVSVTLVQGLTQTPQPTLIIDDGANVLFQAFGSTTAQNASTTVQYTWAPGLATTGGGAGTVSAGALPLELVIPAGFRIRTSTLGIGANSDYGVPSYYVVEIG
jgi:hypothetical protein